MEPDKLIKGLAIMQPCYLEITVNRAIDGDALGIGSSVIEIELIVYLPCPVPVSDILHFL